MFASNNFLRVVAASVLLLPGQRHSAQAQASNTFASGNPLASAGGSNDRGVSFVHGFQSSSDTWASTANILAGAYRFRPLLPNLQWKNTYETQALELKGQLGADTLNLAGIGHSNGGIVLREARRAGVNITSITTLATPHQGAPMMASARAGKFDYYATHYFSQMFAPWSSAPRPASSVWRLLFDFHHWGAGTWGNVFSLVRNFVMSSWDVAGEMEPYSAFQSVLGTNDIHGTPESAMPNRVSIMATAPAPTTGIIFSGIKPDFRTLAIPARTAMIATYVMFGAYYGAQHRSTSDYMYGWYRTAEAEFYLGAASMLAWDKMWCELIGTYQGPLSSCAPSDGVVPYSRQYWPGAAFVNVTSNGHAGETKDPNLTGIIGQSGLGGRGIPRR